MMRFLVLMMISFACGFENLLLIGPKKITYPLAIHYARFYNIPLLDQPTYFYPSRYIAMTQEENNTNTSLSSTRTINIKDYPYPGRDPNYFISWLKQTSS